MSSRTAAVACLALYVLAIGSDAQVSDDATRKCLNCICYASTKCNTQIGCTNGGPNSYFCGPYQISYAYWVDAGKPGNFDHFEKCLKDQVCAETAVVNYMNKWGTDCDGDGQVTCYDYARMHKAGRSGCQAASWVDATDYWAQFQECFGPSPSPQGLGPGDDSGISGLDARSNKRN
ncbi:lysozyme isoform X1 [Rhipicephalus microplus]|uniref:lysozyme isoform X1 n=1 Tax=Rhipicephalus microplus TaxID=6941 RepID=UPI003F6B038D